MRYACSLLFVFLLTTTLHAQPAPANDPRTIRTSGTATIYVQPDEVEVSFTVQTIDADLAKAKAENDRVAREIIEFVRKLKVEEKDIQSTSMRADRVYEEPRDKPRELKGYSVNRTYAIVLRDVKGLEPLTDHLLTRTDVTLGGHEFRTSESRKFRDEARKKAIRAAREKAVLLAGELDCTVGAARQISEATQSYAPYARQNVMGNSNDHDDRNAVDGGSGTTHLGQIQMVATIEVTFDLNPK